MSSMMARRCWDWSDMPLFQQSPDIKELERWLGGGISSGTSRGLISNSGWRKCNWKCFPSSSFSLSLSTTPSPILSLLPGHLQSSLIAVELYCGKQSVGLWRRSPKASMSPKQRATKFTNGRRYLREMMGAERGLVVVKDSSSVSVRLPVWMRDRPGPVRLTLPTHLILPSHTLPFYKMQFLKIIHGFVFFFLLS